MLFSTQSEQVKDIMTGINESLVHETHEQVQQKEQEQIQISEEQILEAHFEVIDHCLVSNSTNQVCEYCRPGFFKDGNVCENCVVGCMKCQNVDQCDKCFEGFKLNDGQCDSKQVGCILWVFIYVIILQIIDVSPEGSLRTVRLVYLF